MGRFEKGGYYRGRRDAELQWLEDGFNLVGAVFVRSIILFVVGICQLIYGIFTLITSDDSR
jgi:hypothetical protein